MDKKITYEQYKKPYCKKHYKKFNRGMDKNTRQILWTVIWMMFIMGLCVLFNNAAPLWLLGFWFLGLFE